MTAAPGRRWRRLPWRLFLRSDPRLCQKIYEQCVEFVFRSRATCGQSGFAALLRACAPRPPGCSSGRMSSCLNTGQESMPSARLGTCRPAEDPVVLSWTRFTMEPRMGVCRAVAQLMTCQRAPSKWFVFDSRSVMTILSQFARFRARPGKDVHLLSRDFDPYPEWFRPGIAHYRGELLKYKKSLARIVRNLLEGHQPKSLSVEVSGEFVAGGIPSGLFEAFAGLPPPARPDSRRFGSGSSAACRVNWSRPDIRPRPPRGRAGVMKSSQARPCRSRPIPSRRMPARNPGSGSGGL